MTKADFDNAIPSFDSKFTTNKTISVSIENLLKKLQKLDLSYFHGKSHFEEDGAQNYLVFQPINRYFKHIGNRKSKGLSDETIKPPATSDNSLNPLIDYVDDKIRKNKTKYTHGTMVTIYIVYELGSSGSNNSDLH